MSRHRIPAPAIASAIGATLLLGACASGPDAIVKKPYSPGDGIVGNSGSIRVLNSIVVAPEGGATGVINMTVVNRGDRADELTAVTSDKGTVDYAGSRTLAPGKAVTLDAESNPSAQIRDITAKPGEFITLVLSFRGTAPLQLRTLVVPATGYYATVTPAAAPTPTDTTTGTPSGSGSATPSASISATPSGAAGTPSGAASGTPTPSP